MARFCPLHLRSQNLVHIKNNVTEDETVDGMPGCMWRICQFIGAEDVGQNKLKNYTGQACTASIWVKSNSEVEYVSQGNLKEFPHPRRNKINSISE